MTHRQPSETRRCQVQPLPGKDNSRYSFFVFGKEFFIFNDKTMNTINISRIIDNGSKEEKEIYELAEEDKYKYRLLGQSIGINMVHCVQLGADHKDDFWHRVYGYSIIRDGKEAKMMTEAMRKVKPKTESYITVAFYERFADRKIVYVPKHLEIPDLPELNNFPFNIAFGTATLDDNNTERHETSLYEPDLSTFTQKGVEQKMKYYNKLNPERHFWAEIVYNTRDRSYVGTKYRDDQDAGKAFGTEWNAFFVHFTALGVTDGEDV